MKLALRDAEFWVPERGLLRLEQAHGSRIRCIAGRVWVTVAGRQDDVFLAEGESFEVSGRGLTLLEALTASRVTLEPAGAGEKTISY